MRIHFQNLNYPASAARRLQTLIGESLAVCQERTAFVLGYRDYHELQLDVGCHLASVLDDRLSDDGVQDRLAFQAARYSNAAKVSRELAVALVSLWRPSAGRSDAYDDLRRARKCQFDSKYDQAERSAKVSVLIDMLQKTLGWQLLAVDLVAAYNTPICFTYSDQLKALIPVYAPTILFHPSSDRDIRRKGINKDGVQSVERSGSRAALLLVRDTCAEDPQEAHFYLGSLFHAGQWKHLSWHQGLTSFDKLLAQSLAVPNWLPDTESLLPEDTGFIVQKAYRASLDRHNADPYSEAFESPPWD